MLFFMLMKCYNANSCWHFNIYEQEKIHAQLSEHDFFITPEPGVTDVPLNRTRNCEVILRTTESIFYKFKKWSLDKTCRADWESDLYRFLT